MFHSDLNPGKIMMGMQDDKRLLSSKNQEYLRLLQQKAEAERVYHIAVAEKTLSAKSEGHPVSIITALVKGDKYVADLKKNYDIADGIAKCCLESMKDIRSSIDSARSYLSWLKTERLNQ